MTDRNATILRLLQDRADQARATHRRELRKRIIRERREMRDGWLGMRGEA